jgi:hypothetical protein
LCFNLDKKTSDRADVAVEISRLGARQVGKEAPDPRREMFFEDLLLAFDRCGKLSTDQAGHDLAKKGGVVFWLAELIAPFDAEPPQVLAQARQRTLVEKAGQVI